MTPSQDAINQKAGIRKSMAGLSVFMILISLAIALSYSPASAISGQRLTQALTQKGNKLSALKATMRITSTYERNNSTHRLKGFLIYRRPLDFRFQGVGASGNPLFELSFRGIKFDLYIPTEGKIIKGDRQCFSRAFPDVAEVKGLIPLALLQWKDVKFQEAGATQGNRVTLKLRSEGETWRATVDMGRMAVIKLERMQGAEADLVAEFGDFSSGEYGWLPKRFRVVAKTGGWQTMVKMTNIETNPFLVEKNFVLEPMFSPKVEYCK